MNQVTTIDTAFTDLIDSSSNNRQRESLERIKSACDYLEEQGLKLTPTAIERYCIDRGWEGPKAQSIRNSKHVLHRYVQLRQSGQKLAVRRNKAIASPPIPDETLRAYVQLLKEERDQAIAARHRIEAGLRLIPGIPVDDLIRMGFGNKSLATQAKKENVRLPAMVREALETLLKTEHIANCGLQIHKDRIRQAITGNVLLEKHHVIALRNLLVSPEACSELN